jgi:hypothetical protein
MRISESCQWRQSNNSCWPQAMAIRYIPLSERRFEHTLTVPGRCLKDPHNPTPAKDPSNDGTTRAGLPSEAMSDAGTLEKKKAGY